VVDAADKVAVLGQCHRVPPVDACHPASPMLGTRSDVCQRVRCLHDAIVDDSSDDYDEPPTGSLNIAEDRWPEVRPA
jgi:hypothetical protein